MFLLILLWSPCTYAQVTSEGMDEFLPELDSIVLNADPNEWPEISIEIRPFQQREDKKPFFREKLTYKFLNDSIFELTIHDIHETIYGLIRNGKVHEYDMDEKKPLSYIGGEKRDSAGYTLIKYLYTFDGDTTVSRRRIKYDSEDRLTELLYDGPRGRELVSWEYEGSTSLYRRFELLDNDTVLCFQSWYRTKWVLPKTFLLDTMINTRYDSSGSSTDTTVFIWNYEYNKHGLLSTVWRYNYYPENDDWFEKSTMIVTYRKRKRKRYAR